jgi:hypothetical protein
VNDPLTHVIVRGTSTILRCRHDRWVRGFIGDENANCAPAFKRGSALKRRRFKQIIRLEDRLVEEATPLRETVDAADQRNSILGLRHLAPGERAGGDTERRH